MIATASPAAHAPAWAARPIQGVGLGLRAPHIDRILRERPAIPWLELLADNWLAPGGPIPARLNAIRQHYPVSFHCVGMSLGGTDPLNLDYLGRIRDLAARFEPAWISDHLCFTGVHDHNLHDLLPLPYTIETLRHVAARIKQAQDFLGRRLLIENVSSYLSYQASDLGEAEFVAELAQVADCDLLLDINNIHVNAVNLGLDAEAYLERMPVERVREVHLAGYETRDGYLLDAHNHPVSEAVWSLYARFQQRRPNVPTLIEWDKDIPELELLLAETRRAAGIQARAGRRSGAEAA